MACGGGDDSRDEASTTTSTTAASTTTTTVAPTTTTTLPPPTVDSLLAALTAAGLPIGATITYTAETDTNDLLGRPGMYTGKVAWIDNRVADECLELGVPDFDCGGTAEVFANDDDRDERYRYLGGFADQSFAGGYYMWRLPGMVVRVGYELTPAVAGEYAAVLEQLAPGEVEQFAP
jgi:hypothetical protein